MALSSAKASSPKPSTSPVSRATARAAPSTLSSTTRSPSPPSPKTPAPLATAPPQENLWVSPSSISMGMILWPLPPSSNWPSNSASAFTKISFSTSWDTAATATTKEMNPVSLNRPSTPKSMPTPPSVACSLANFWMPESSPKKKSKKSDLRSIPCPRKLCANPASPWPN